MTAVASNAPAFVLVSHALCPYVQRAAITLAEKGLAVERRYIDLADKPAWFRTISPLGKVPLLIVQAGDGDESVIFESMVICEYLEDLRIGAALHPVDPLKRALRRSWIEFGSSILADLWHFETATDASAYETKRQALSQKFDRIEAELGDGPFFSGDRFSFVDVVYAPIFRYFDVFDALVDTRIFAGKPKVMAWRSALSRRPSVKEAVLPDYGDRLRIFLREHDAYLLRIANHSESRPI